jgi:hypothetical protein
MKTFTTSPGVAVGKILSQHKSANCKVNLLLTMTVINESGPKRESKTVGSIWNKEKGSKSCATPYSGHIISFGRLVNMGVVDVGKSFLGAEGLCGADSGDDFFC